MKFISQADYLGKHFRIGRALKPDLSEKYKDEDWVYGKLEKYCQGEKLPLFLWETWKESRNLLFHWFPEEKNAVSHIEAVARLLQIVTAIDEVFSVCEIELKNGKGK